ncbi:CDP-alcohol phosphatidyltransferase family protein [Cellulomonas sp. PhB143]|uniref:CDP-alcohol phosphatidyltransferase family protein n=1 Tax=Cellulomonas sp. PhB143 TaxID=2485186 RepID=UPI0018F35350|nr:CDP-alcohol phosphatidyltransferase family protein [Cellulomonas sp. PhB143]
MTELSGAQKSARGVSFYSRWVNRPLGRYFAAGAHVIGASPNQVSIASAVVTGAGVLVVALAMPSWWIGVLAWFLLALGFVLDSSDGQVARLSGKSSKSGEWLDHVIDAAKTVAVHSGVLVAWFRADVDASLLLVPLIFQLLAVTSFAGGILADLLSGPGKEIRPPSTVRATILLSVDYGVFCLSFLAMGSMNAWVVVYTLLACARIVISCAMLPRWFRMLRADA